MTMRRRPTPVATVVALAVLIAATAYLAWVETRAPATVDAPAATAASAPARVDAPAPAPRAAARDGALVMRDQRILDERGRVLFEGDVDLAPVFARIAAGTRDPHRNDGATFANREGRLPRRPRGYYTEWVIRTPGRGGVGPQRLVTGGDGEAWYTPDHYGSFVPVRPPS